MAPGGVRPRGIPDGAPTPASDAPVLPMNPIPHQDSLGQAWLAWRNLWRANRRHLLSLFLAGLTINVLGLTVPVFTSIVYDKIIGNGALASLWALAIGMTIGVVLDFVLRQARVLIVEHVGARWDRALDARIFAGLLRTSLASPPEIGPTLARYREVFATRDFLSSAYLLPVADLPFVLLFLLAVWLLGGAMVLVPLVLGVLLLLAAHAGHHAAQRYYMRHIRDGNEKTSLLAESLVALETLRRPRSGARVARRFMALAETSSRDAARARARHALYQSLLPGVSSLSTVATLVVGVYLVEAQQMSLGGLIACSMLVSRCVMLFGSVASLFNRYREFTRAMADMTDLIALADGKHVTRPAGRRGARLAVPELTLSRAGLRRPGADRAVLNDVNLHLDTHEFVALLGRAGSGKSTLLRVLSGRLALTTGSLVAGGVEVDPQGGAWLAACVGYKAQEPQFMKGSIGDVLADAGEEVAPNVRLDTLRAVGLAQALQTGELSLSTPLGNFGQGLSGGQRQMLGLASAVLQGESVMLLDEPTLGLDSAALQQVVQLLAQLKGKRTIVVATHATELIQLADRLVVLDQGKVIADGPREKLLVNEN